MASIDAAINIVVNGQQRVDRILSSLDQVSSAVEQITRQPINLNVGDTTRGLQAELNNLDRARQRFAQVRTQAEERYETVLRRTSASLTRNFEIIRSAEARGGRATETARYAQAVERGNRSLTRAGDAQRRYADELERANAEEENAVNTSERRQRALRRNLTTLEEIDRLARGFTNAGAGSVIGETFRPADLQRTIRLFQELASNVEITSANYRRFTLAAAAASVESGREQIQRFNILADAFRGGRASQQQFSPSYGGPGRAVDELIAAFPRVARSEAGLESYKQQLEEIKRLTPVASENFIRLGSAIREVDTLLSRLSRRDSSAAFGPMEVGPSARGPAIEIGSTRAAQEQLRYDKQMLDTRQNLQRVSTEIDNILASSQQKDRLRAQLGGGFLALDQGRLEAAQEIFKQTQADTRIARRDFRDQQIQGDRRIRHTQKLQDATERLGNAAQKLRDIQAGVYSNKDLDQFLDSQRKIGAEYGKQNKENREADRLLQQRIDSTAALPDQLRKLQTIQNNYNKAKEKGARFTQQEEQLLSDTIAKLSSPAFKAAAGTQKAVGSIIGSFESIRRLRLSEIPTGAGVGAGGASAEVLEQRRNRLLESALRLQQNIGGLESKGADFGAQKLALEQKILEVKGLQGKASQRDIEIAAAGLQEIRTGVQGVSAAFAGESGFSRSFKQLQASLSESRGFFGDADPRQALNQIYQQFNQGRGAGGGGTSAGENIVNTFAASIKAGQSKVVTVFRALARIAKGEFEGEWGIASPSRVAREWGENIVNSLASAIISGSSVISSAVEKALSPKNIDRGYQQAAGRGARSARGFDVGIAPSVFSRFSSSSTSGTAFNPLGVFQTGPTRPISAPGSAYPFFPSYNLSATNLSATRFPFEPPAELSQGRNRLGDTSRVLSESIRSYRAAVDNFWEGEDSQFEAVKKVVVSSARLAAAKTARRLQQSRDLSTTEKFEQLAAQARSSISTASSGSRLTNVVDLITGGPQAGISSYLANVWQRSSDSILNSTEELGMSIANSFDDAVDRVRSAASGILDRTIFAAIGSGAGGGGGAGGSAAGAAGGGTPPSRIAYTPGEAIPDIRNLPSFQLEQLATSVAEFRSQLDPTVNSFDRLERETRELIGSIQREQQARDPGADFLVRRTRDPRVASAISEGLIGGAFPLLFGQGVGASIGGGLGGAAGGFLGGGLGFGLSLIGTALGTAFDTLQVKAIELGSALNDTSKTFDLVKERSLFSDRELEKVVNRLQEAGLVATASEAAQREVFTKVGSSGVQNLQNLETQSDRVNRAWAELSIQLQAAVAGPLSDLLNWTSKILESGSQRRRLTSIGEELQAASPENFRRFQKALVNEQQRFQGVGAGSPIESALRGRGQSAAEGGNVSRAVFNLNDEAVSKLVKQFQSEITIRAKIDKKQLREELISTWNSQISAISSQLETIDASKGINDRIKGIQRQQQDLDRQSADIRKNYEEQIGDIRLGVEREVRQQSLENIKSQNELYQVQGQARLQQIKNATAELVSAQRGDEFGQRLLGLFGQIAELQLSTEQDIENKRRQFEADLVGRSIQAEISKADIAKQVARLNEGTAKQIENINRSVRIQNEDYDQRRFELEKRIASIKLKIAQEEVASNRALVENTIAQLQSFQQTPETQQRLQVQRELLALLKDQVEAIKDAQSELARPLKLPRLASTSGPSLQSVSTAALDAARASAGALAKSIFEAGNQLAGLVAQGSWTEIKNGFLDLADQGFLAAKKRLDEFLASAGTGFANTTPEITKWIDTANASIRSIETGALDENARKLRDSLKLTSNESLRTFLALQVETAKLAELQASGAETANYLADSFDALGQEGDQLVERLKELTQFGTAYEVTLQNLVTKGLDPATESSRKLLAEAQRIDILREKVAAIEGFTNAADLLSGSMRSLVGRFAEFGSASEAVKEVSKEFGKQSFEMVLDFAFKPLEDAMRKNMLNIAKELGFDISTPAEKQLTNLEQINASVGTIKSEMTRLIDALNRLNPQLQTQSQANTSGQAGVPVLATTGYSMSQAQKDYISSTAGEFRSYLATISDPSLLRTETDLIKRDLTDLAKRQYGQAMAPEQSYFVDQANLALEGVYSQRMSELQQPGTAVQQQAQEKLNGVSAAVEDMTGKTAASVQKLQTQVIPEWGRSLGKAVTGLGTAASAVVSIMGGIQMIDKGGAGNIFSGIGSILTTIGSVVGMAGGAGMFGAGAKPMSANGFFNPTTGKGIAGPNFGLANGGVFAGNGIEPFAMGGIVSSPTLFQFADGGKFSTGLMGEAGPEAILPLERGSDGKLGVRAGLSVPFEGGSITQDEEPDVAGDRPSTTDVRRMAAAATLLRVPFAKGATGAGGAASGGSYVSPGAASSGATAVAETETVIRFESTVINGVEFVTRDEAEQIGRTAAARGADLAQRRLKNNPSARRSIGI